MGDHTIRYAPFRGRRIDPPCPPPNTSNCLNDKALMALPFIGIYAGVDELVPSKAVYAIYEPQTGGLRFVRGDGTFVAPEQICFIERFNSACSPQVSAETYLAGSMRKNSLKYVELMHFEDRRTAADIKKQFPTISSVKSSLTYVSDLTFGAKGKNMIPATQIPDLEEFAAGAQINDLHLCIPLSCDPKWDFNPTGFQALIAQAVAADWLPKHEAFTKNYIAPHITFDDFQHALYCLVGMQQSGLVTFVHVSQNDPRYFVEDLTPDLPPKIRKPFETTIGWKIEDFVVRFAKWERLREAAGGLVRWVDPVRWLEAELEWEERKAGGRLVEGDGPEGIITWEELIGVEWMARGGGKLLGYPRPFVPIVCAPVVIGTSFVTLLIVSKSKQPLQLSDIICPRTGKFKESKRAKMERKDKEKAEREGAEARRESVVDFIDLSYEDDLSFGHMNSAPGTITRKRPSNASQDPFSDDYDIYAYDSTHQPTPRKRVRSPSAHWQQQMYHYGGESSQPSNRSIKENSIFVPRERDSQPTPQSRLSILPSIEEDIYGLSDEEQGRQAQKRVRRHHRSPSPIRAFKKPQGWQEFGDEPRRPLVSTPRKNLGSGSIYDCPYPTPSKSGNNTKFPQRTRPTSNVEEQHRLRIARELSDFADEEAPHYFQEKSGGKISHYSTGSYIGSSFNNSTTSRRSEKRNGATAIPSNKQVKNETIDEDSDITDEEILRIENPAFMSKAMCESSSSEKKPRKLQVNGRGNPSPSHLHLLP